MTNDQPPRPGAKLLLIPLIVLVLAGAFGYGGGAYRGPGIGIGGILLMADVNVGP